MDDAEREEQERKAAEEKKRAIAKRCSDRYRQLSPTALLQARWQPARLQVLSSLVIVVEQDSEARDASELVATASRRRAVIREGHRSFYVPRFGASRLVAYVEKPPPPLRALWKSSSRRTVGHS